MKKSTLEVAKGLMARRDFSTAIKVLQSRKEQYEDSFDYYCTLGIACLYIGDFGSAVHYFENARRIKVNNPTMLLGQAAIFLRRGDTERAVQYYLDILDTEPRNEVAKAGLEFIRTHGDYETICKYVYSGKIEQFYPPLPINPKSIYFIICASVIGIIFGILIVNLFVPKAIPQQLRADLSELALTTDEIKYPQEKDISKNLVHYILSDREIKQSYKKATEYFHEYNDNGAQLEINRLLNSNAALGIRQKARLLMEYIKEPTFDSIKQNFSIEEVKKDPYLYLDCFVDWSGRIANEEKLEKSEKFTLLVGYEDQKNVQGTVLVELDFIPNPELDGSKPIRVLGRVCLDGDKVYLKGKSVYQNINQ